MKIELIDAKRHHCGLMARHLRAPHRDLMVRAGVQTHRELVARFSSSSYRKALLIDGTLVALGGVDGTMLASSGLVWLALSEEAARHASAVTRTMLRCAEEVLHTRDRIATLILADDHRSLDFARFIGFYAEEKTEIRGEVAYTMVLKRRLERVA